MGQFSKGPVGTVGHGERVGSALSCPASSYRTATVGAREERQHISEVEKGQSQGPGTDAFLPTKQTVLFSFD
jgi:hypothetical protein